MFPVRLRTDEAFLRTDRGNFNPRRTSTRLDDDDDDGTRLQWIFRLDSTGRSRWDVMYDRGENEVVARARWQLLVITGGLYELVDNDVLAACTSEGDGDDSLSADMARMRDMIRSGPRGGAGV